VRLGLRKYQQCKFKTQIMSFCVFCHDEEGPFLSPCLCTGSIGLIHRACLIRWGQKKCPTCQQTYQTLVLTWEETFTKRARQLYEFITSWGLTVIQLNPILLHLLRLFGLVNRDVNFFFTAFAILVMFVVLYDRFPRPLAEFLRHQHA
jgi:hypothetical protein